jgi:hypothetical protein
MTTQPFVESGMTFGPYPEGHCCFRIEKSHTYRKVQDGVRMAEFLLLRPSEGKPASLWIVEAKSSTPRPVTRPNFDDFIEEIRQKLTNALSLCVAACLKRHPTAEAELPEPFKAVDLSTAQFRLILLVKDHQEAWLPDLKDSLSKTLRATIQTWALSPTAVEVLNDDLARKHGLIHANAGPDA